MMVGCYLSVHCVKDSNFRALLDHRIESEWFQQMSCHLDLTILVGLPTFLVRLNAAIEAIMAQIQEVKLETMFN